MLVFPNNSRVFQWTISKVKYIPKATHYSSWGLRFIRRPSVMRQQRRPLRTHTAQFQSRKQRQRHSSSNQWLKGSWMARYGWRQIPRNCEQHGKERKKKSDQNNGDLASDWQPLDELLRLSSHLQKSQQICPLQQLYFF